MKIYNLPDAVRKCKPSYNDDWQKQEADYIDKLLKWVMENGNGKNRGKQVRYQIADGYAHYMIFSEKPAALIHFPIGDAYSYSMVSRFTMKEILSDIKREEAFKAMFSKK